MDDGGPLFLFFVIGIIVGAFCGYCSGNHDRHSELCQVRLANAHTAKDSVIVYTSDSFCAKKN